MGFPTRDKRSTFGEEYEDTYPVNNPKREISAGIFNVSYWDLAGLCQTGLKAAVKASVSGSIVTVDYFGLAWDPNAGISPITFTRARAGHYTFAFASQYPDEQGVNRSIALSHGVAHPVDSVIDRGNHDGGNNESILTDTGQAWTTDEFVGQYVHNLTDGSRGIITANTATTVTAILSGGTENLWDSADSYMIVGEMLTGMCNLTSGYQGELLFFGKDHNLADPVAFALLLW